MGYIPALKNYQNSKNYNIYFTHVPTGNEVSFPAIIKSFQDQFSSTHNPTEVYGRMDPIYNFQRTKRKITCAFDCVAATKLEAYQNLKSMSSLITFLYPTYKSIDDASTISSPPLFRIKLMNLMQSANPPPDNGVAGDGEQPPVDNIGNGLLGFVDGFTYNPAFGQMTFVDDYDFITPISFPVQFSLNVVHEHDLGWSEGETASFAQAGLFGGDVAGKTAALQAAAAARLQRLGERAEAYSVAGGTDVANVAREIASDLDESLTDAQLEIDAAEGG